MCCRQSAASLRDAAPAGWRARNVSDESGKLVVSSGNAEYAIPVKDAAQYPRMEIPCPAATVPVSGIPSLTKRTAFAVSEDTTRPMLKCVNLIFGTDGLQAVSTDSFRIASAKGDRESRGNISFLVPAASLEKLAALVDNREKLQVGTTGKPLCSRKRTSRSPRELWKDHILPCRRCCPI